MRITITCPHCGKPIEIEVEKPRPHVGPWETKDAG